MAEHQKITLSLEKPKTEGMAWFDADKMDKIIYNLLSNAIKYNKVGGKIDVSLSLGKEQAVITISDNGIGMSKEKMKHLYTRFSVLCRKHMIVLAHPYPAYQEECVCT